MRDGATAPGSKRRSSTPRGMTRSRAGSVPWRARRCSAMKPLMAMTRSPRAMTEL